MADSEIEFEDEVLRERAADVRDLDALIVGALRNEEPLFDSDKVPEHIRKRLVHIFSVNWPEMNPSIQNAFTTWGEFFMMLNECVVVCRNAKAIMAVAMSQVTEKPKAEDGR